MKPWLWLPPQLAHDLSPVALKCITAFQPLNTPEFRPFEWRGLRFKNPLGIAGGVDKDGRTIVPWWKLGVGFLEVGTVTPEPQSPNPGKIMNRDSAKTALWNKMGFPNGGAKNLALRLSKISKPYPTPLFINVGKNRSIPNEEASSDYIKCMDVLAPFADAFVVNISSPNTKGLRDLQEKSLFENFLSPILQHRKGTGGQPTLLKISPDMNDESLQTVVKTAVDLGIDGWIVSNTTAQREAGLNFPTEGGVSGRPVAELSKRALEKLLKLLGTDRADQLIVSVGGITSAAEVRQRLEMGANLVQTYSGIVFGGPFFFKKTLTKLN